MNDSQSTLILVARLMGVAVMLQSLEFIKMKESISENGIWRWSQLRAEYQFLPKIILKFLDWIMQSHRFIEMMTVRFCAAIITIIYPNALVIFFILFISTFLITLRWRGSFNGGSDYLTLIILLSLSIGFISPLFAKAALWYITLQVISSYFLAGLYKIKATKWRLGTAVYGFVSSPNYKTPKFIIEKSRDPSWAQAIAWSVIIFELSFPLVLTLPILTKFYLLAGVLFHLVNFVTFGLNRFFWVWCASYPAIYYCGHLI